jgi:hypothetical protein
MFHQVVRQSDGWELEDLGGKHALLSKDGVWRIAKVLSYLGIFSIIFVDKFPPMTEDQALDLYTRPGDL